MERWFEGRSREVIGFVGAFLLSLFAAVAVTWPVALHLDQVVLGGGELGGWLWRYDWHFRSLDGLMAAELSPFRLWFEFVSLGRYPETGNILDVLALSYPLDRTLGFPASYNVKILLILALNGVCAYALGRYFSGSVSAALAACVIGAVNPLTIQEIQACGLRQALLWWVLLYPPLLDRALRRRTLPSGLLAGVCFGLAAAYYWFYGLFTGIFTLLWLAKHLITERNRLHWGGLARSVAGVGLGLALSAGPFILPYALPQEGTRTGGASQLPEMTFFLPYPAYDTVVNAPMRPATYAENLLASLHRAIGSSWSTTYPFDPTLNESLQVVVLLLGVLPAFWRPKSWGWLAVWIFFYLGTLGPFLRIGAGDAERVTKVFDDYVVRLPWTWMFQFIPGMSRMFAPYRLAAFVIVASVALLAIGVSRFRWRVWIAPLVIAASIVQPMMRFGKGAVNEGDADSRELRTPIKINRIRVPEFYQTLDNHALEGIIELPVDQQQDLLYYYQIVHGRKVYRSWASPAAVPPALRPEGAGGEYGAQLRYQARADSVTGPVPDTLMAVSRIPDTADISVLGTDAFVKWARTNRYTQLIVHERGYYLVDPARGGELYDVAVRRLGEVLATEASQHEELRKGDPANPQLGVPIVGDLVPWTSQPADLPPERAPAVYRMAVFDLPQVRAAIAEVEAARAAAEAATPAEGTAAEATAPDAEPTPSEAGGDPTPKAAPPPADGGLPTAPEPAPPGAPGGAPIPASAPSAG